MFVACCLVEAVGERDFTLCGGGRFAPRRYSLRTGGESFLTVVFLSFLWASG